MLFSMKIPNLLTLLRIVLIPVFVLVFYLPYSWAPYWAGFIFALAAVTDWFDGYLARKLNQLSPFGAFLDPVADKLLVAVGLLLIVERESIWWITLAAIIIISREITISALREWMAEVGQRSKVAVAYVGKVKAVTQILSLVFLLYNKDLFGIPIRELGLIMLAIATVLTFYSMVQYLRDAFTNQPD